MATNSTILTTPHNLSTLSTASTMADYLFVINQASNGVLIGSILILTYALVFYASYRQNYTVVSCVAYASYVTFIISLLGSSWVRSGIPLISTKITIFFFVLAALSTFIIWFSGEK